MSSDGGDAVRVVVSGASGLIGSALVPFLTRHGHEVRRLVRRQPRPGEQAVWWDPAAGQLDGAGLEGLDAAVHLSGEPLSPGRWSAEKKRRIRESRVGSTRLLAQSLAGLRHRPQVMVSASAIGYYGDRGDEALREDSPPGSGLLPDVCCAWEGATAPAADAGIRVVRLRMGLVLAPRGGVLAKMLPFFRLALGAAFGSGRQFMSWIALDDLGAAMEHALANETLRGPVNATAPHAVTNLDFTRTLGRVLRRPAFLRVPAFLARLLFGREMADALLLASARVVPAKLQESGFTFRYPELEPALRHVLGREKGTGTFSAKHLPGRCGKMYLSPFLGAARGRRP